MKRFKFNLQPLLDLREAKEKEIKNELSSLVSKQNVERQKQETLQMNLNGEHNRMTQKMRLGDLTSDEILNYARFVICSEIAMKSAGRKIDDYEPSISKVRVRLINASKEKKVVEKLREKKKEEFNYEMNREITKENDDINQKIYAARRSIL
jgi:flagellar FliJ protein